MFTHPDDGNAYFYLEDYLPRPTIAYNADNLIEITPAQTPGEGETITIKYTTDNSTPTSEHGETYSEPFDPADNVTTIKAVVIITSNSGTEVSNVTTFTPPVLLGSSHKRLIQSQANGWDTDFHFYMIPGDPSNDITKVNTTSLFRPTMEWYFESAGIEDGVQYYYIVNPTTSKNLCYDGTNGVYMDTKTTTDNKFKFSIVESSTTGSFNISPYGENKKFINKGGNNNNAAPDDLGLKTENTTYSNTASARWKFILPSTLDKKAPFTASNGTTSYYQIENIGNIGNFIVPPTGTATFAEVTASGEASANWYFEVAPPADNNDWLTYYYIRNAVTGDYLFFTKDTYKVSNSFEMRSTVDTDDDHYKFAWARTATSNQYYIVPKVLKDPIQNTIGSFAYSGSGGISTNMTRSAGELAWLFLPSTFNLAEPGISFNATDNKYHITSEASDAKIYYRILELDNQTVITDWTLYDKENHLQMPSSACFIKAYAYRSGDKSDESDEASFKVTQVATPTFNQSSGNSIAIECETEGATIYYTYDGSDPTTSNTKTEYTHPLTDADTGGSLSGKTIKAIAVKAGSVTSEVATSNSITLRCATPVVRRGNGNFALTCSFPTEGVTIKYSYASGETDPGTPTLTYSTPVSCTFPITIKAVATASGYSDSEVLIKYIGTGLAQDENDVYLIESEVDLTTFVGMVNGTEEEYANAHYRLTADVSGSGIDPITNPFTGIFEAGHDDNGNYYKISGLTHALFNTVDGGTVKNVMLDNVDVNVNGNAGAIANEATGAARIYNCGVLATSSDVETGSTVEKDKDGYDKITKSSSTISGSNYVGSIVGLLDGEARVINCFSFANITGGSYRGGIVGYNNVEGSNSTNLKTMVMNCMYYGNIDGGNIAPIYNGHIITNRSDQSGVSNFNYFWSGASYTNSINTYNCALTAETRYLQRFEFFRHILNSNRELAAWWATGSLDNKKEMLKWVMEPSQIGTTTPFPILKAPSKYYPSVVNIDAEHAESFTGDAEQQKAQRNQGRKFNTTFTINIQMGTSGDGYHPATGASITTSSVTRNITDKDPKHFNFNYYKVQLPYYNEVGSNNYRKDGSGVSRVVTGWKIVSMSKSAGSFTTGSDATATVDENGDISLTTPYNFADRNCTAKDIYSETNKRVFSQGAYFDVPEGVTSITIEPYWAQCVYVSDAYPDVVYDQGMSNANNVKTVGTVSEQARYTNGQSYSINGDNQVVYTTMSNAAGQMPTSGTVYDNAIVLVGNVHSTDVSDKSSNKAYTIMSIDLDKDNEPDYSYILRYNSRLRVHPVRVDFVNIPGLGMAQKSTGGTGTYNFGIMQPLGWFESTNTSLFRFTQFEYDYAGRANSPMILQGGVIEQWVTVGGKEQTIKEAKSVSYYHVGGNVWFKEFHIGVHQDKTQDEFVSPHPPISVTGGDFNELYLTGLYNTPNANYDDNAECYINGGRFGKVSGTGMQGIGAIGGNSKGNIIWQIDNADIDEFYAGGINAAHIAEGNITTVIKNSRVDQFCGGPKFGNMNSTKKVVTNATNCTFRAFFGAGYGGNSYNRRYPDNKTNINGNNGIGWDNWVQGQYTKKYDANYKGVETRIDYQFLPMSNNTQNVARLFVDYVSFSLATTYDVTSKLSGCTITTQPLGRLSISNDFKCLGNFYGGGSLGKVSGDVKSTLTNCTVDGSVFGAGYSATLPKVNVMNNAFQKIPHYDENTGAYTEAILPTTEEYSWEHKETVNNTNTAINPGAHKLYTTENLNELGTVTGQVTLNIDGTTAITGNVYGGGQSSDATGDVEVNVKAGSMVDVYGGGQGETTVVGGTVNVNIGAKANNGDLSGTGSISGSVYGGSALGAVNATSTKNAEGKVTAYTPSAGKTTNVNIYAGAVTGSVFGGGLGRLANGNDPNANGYLPAIAAQNFGNTTVTMEGGTVSTGLYGGANINGVLKGNSTVTITGGTIGTAWTTPVPDPLPDVVFGGGYGQPTLVEGNVEINLGAANQTTAGATINGSVYGGGALGNTNASWQPGANENDAPVLTPTANSTTAVNLYKGTVKGDVYGGGLGVKEVIAVSASPAVYYTQQEIDNANKGDDAYGKTTSDIKTPAVEAVEGVEGIPSTVGGNVTVELNNGVGDDAKGCIVEGAIFGCNNANGTPKGSVTVHIYGTQNADEDMTTIGDKYTPPYYTSGRKEGEGLKMYLQRLVNAATEITGTEEKVVPSAIKEKVGAAAGAAGTAMAALQEEQANRGPNDPNLMGREDILPQADQDLISNLLVGTNENKGPIILLEEALADTKTCFDVKAVYGGGNEAEYKPTDKDGKTEVIIDGCDRSSIRYVYGGGNAAAVPATDVTVNSAKVIDYLFGGGNGERGKAYAAHVGYEGDTYTGIALTKLIGGTIYHVFGGSNSNGDVRGGTSIEMPTPDPTKKCPLIIKEIYGAGQNAEQTGGTKMILGCLQGKPDIFGGSWNANIKGGVTVVITSGEYGKVFGGNDRAGTIQGPIKVSIEETACDPIEIDELYLGGNHAPYSVFGYKEITDPNDNTKTIIVPRTSNDDNEGVKVGEPESGKAYSDNQWYADPILNVVSCTRIGTINGNEIGGGVFGGGLGTEATMYGNPTVNINMIHGAHADEITDDNKLGKITNVYGGGSEAKVVGNATINIGASSSIPMESRDGWEATVEGANVIGNVYGGGQDAEVTGNTQVNICAHEVTTDNTTEWQSLSAISENITIAGSVFGAGKGANTDVASAIVRGNSTIQMGGGWVKQNIYGGGELSCVGDFTFVTTEGATKDDIATYTAGGTSNVNIFAGKVGPETQTKPATYGHVYGAGKGDGSYPKFNYAQATDVTISGSAIVEGSVFGGSENGHVRGNTNVDIKGGTIGVQSIKKGEATVGNVYGGGQGSTDHFDAGIVKGNTNVTISDGIIYHNIYGGGAYGSVGTITYGSADYVPGIASVANMPTAWNRTTNAETGTATVTITGGIIGQDGDENGMIFGSSRGDVESPTDDPALDPNDKLAWVYDTKVTIGTESSETGPTIFGSVYGSGENGHVFNDTDVKIHSGIVGVASGAKMTDSHDVEYDADDYPYRGNVYGGGCGEDKYKDNNNVDKYNPLAGIVLHNTNIAITGGHVVHDVFGAGALGSVGNKSTINISGGRIGVDGDNDGNVYGAARGDLNSTQTDIAHVKETEVNIAYTTTPTMKGDGTPNSTQYILGSVFGGGEAGIVKGNVAVNMSGGYVVQDVYGGGALAHTNTDNWNSGTSTLSYDWEEVTGLTTGTSSVEGLYAYDSEHSTYTEVTDATATAEDGVHYYKNKRKTTVTLSGGIVGNVYGGGLGRMADTSTSTAAVAANVYGDVTVKISNTAFTDSVETFDSYYAYVKNSDPPTLEAEPRNEKGQVPRTGRAFGCNNYYGTPKGNVSVIVYSTKHWQYNNHQKDRYEMRGVYGGGNLADYVPVDVKKMKPKVEIHDCANTSIEKVYGGGNSADVNTTDVTIFGCFDIRYVFGGGNGADKIHKNGIWQESVGANVTGNANVLLKAGTIHDAFLGSDTKGTVDNSTADVTTGDGGDCDYLKLTNFYGASKRAPVDGDVKIRLSACGAQSNITNVFAGSYDAQVRGDITLNVTSGVFENVFGGNDREGYIGGNITINIEEVEDCKPIIIHNLYGGGYDAAYPGNNAKRVKRDENGDIITPHEYVDFGTGKITINVKSCTRIDKIHGGGFGSKAEVTGDTEVNVNMLKGAWAGHIYPASVDDGNGGTTPNTNEDDQIPNTIGVIGDIFGGGEDAKVTGNSTVNIGTETEIKLDTTFTSKPTYLECVGDYTGTLNDKYKILGANITGNIYGGGDKADVTGNTQVNICAKYDEDDDEYEPVTEGTFGVTIAGNVFGAGKGVDYNVKTALVQGNSFVYMGGGNVKECIYGGGELASVGDFTYDSDNKITACTEETGKATVHVFGGKVGPARLVMPNFTGHVFGAGKGTLGTDPLFPKLNYVQETDVTISNNAFIKGSVYGGGEDGHVRGDTYVKIQGGQIGCGYNTSSNTDLDRIYTAEEWAYDVTNNNAQYLYECNHWPYGKEVTEGNVTKTVYAPYDKFANTSGYDSRGGAVEASDGHTFYGNVFGGGSGYEPYAPGEWLRSAGAVYGKTRVDITGGHILTSVYGGNEMTDVGTYTDNDKGYPIVHSSGGECTVNFGGTATLGVPRTLTQIANHPVTCYLFGAGKGDTRTFFNTWTNINKAIVKITGGWIYGSVFGGGEDGHVLGDVDMTIEGAGTKIGTWGTSYVDGNVFGGGRGFSGEALTAGSVGGNVDMKIKNGKILGSVYGGGRLASVGIDFTPPTDYSYGQLVDDISTTKKYGHIKVDISGGTFGGGKAGADNEKDYFDMRHSGNVFGGSMGRITTLDGSTNPLWPKLAVVKLTDVTIRGNANIKRNVYGGSEFGIVRNQATVNIEGGTVEGNVFGGGYGSVEQDKKTTITAGGNSSIPTMYYTFTPMIWSGCVSGNTFVNVSGGWVKRNVYGGGEYASVGRINFNSKEDGEYNYITKHDNPENGFALSWPYEFQYIAAAPDDDSAVGGGTVGGKATVNITGGRIGITGKDVMITGGEKEDNGDVYGGSKGVAGDRYEMAFLANAKETEVKINYTNSSATPENYKTGADANNKGTYDCIAGSVYGGGENGHVMQNATVTLTNGLIGHAIYGGGKGKDKYKTTLNLPGGGTKENADVYSITAGKVYGNTSVTMNGGYVVRNIYGGGNMASVGKGNYAGGSDDRSAGYGEKITTALWNNTDFTGSGKTTVSVTAGQVGYIDTDPTKSIKDGLPYGNIFGGCRGQATAEVEGIDKNPDFYVGYVNETSIAVGDGTGDGPVIYGSVYGGGQDGHVRRDTKVTVNNGTIGQPYSTASDAMKAFALTNAQWQHRGNVYGGGSGISMYEYDGNGNGNTYTDTDNDKEYDEGETRDTYTVSYGDKEYTSYDIGYSSSAGSVTRNTEVEIKGGTIYRNVYGGGSLACVVPPLYAMSAPPYTDATHGKASLSTLKVSGGTIGTLADNALGYGGDVFGAGRGMSHPEIKSDYFALTAGTEVNILPNETLANSPVIAGDVYGGGEMGCVKQDTKVYLTGGTIHHDAYGGGKGIKADVGGIAADVGGNATVELNKDLTSERGCVVNRIFGSNNLNGSPKGEVLVHVYATQNKNKGTVAAKYPREGENGGMEQGNKTDKEYLNTLIEYASQLGITVTSYSTIYGNATATEEEVKTAIKDIWADIAANRARYDVEAVYGGGNLAAYVPNNPATTTNEAKVIIDGCELSSIYQVYGGGNAASTPATNLTINSAYEIFEAFGGGNGNDDYDLDGKHYLNPGANVGYHNYAHFVQQGETDTYEPVDNDNATTKEGRENNYGYGTGIATTNVRGGTIHSVFGGSNKKGNIRKTAMSVYEASDDLCPLCVGETYGAGKDAPMDADIDLTLDCVKDMPIIYGGAKDADVNANITLNITNGTFEKVFGGNNTSGAITGSITVNVEERGCQPIFIKELYGGGYLAPYSIYGYDKDDNGNYTTETINGIPQRKPLTSGDSRQKDPRINIISATRIDNIYGGGYQAKVVGSPRINVNMQEGTIMSKFASMYEGKPIGEAIQVAANDKTYTYTLKESTTTDASYNLAIGTIGNIFGGGNQADIVGDTHIEIGTGKWINANGEEETMGTDKKTYIYNVDKYTNDKNKWGYETTTTTGGENPVTTTTFTPVDNKPAPLRNAAEITGIVYGGGNEGDVTSNTYITMENGSVYNRIYGGGNKGNVGTIETKITPTGHSHTGTGTCIQKPDTWKDNTGVCNVTVSGGRVGPLGMTMPDDYGYVFGAGRGETKDPAENPDIDFEAYVKETNVTIEGTALICGGVYGGSENGRVRGDTHVYIKGGQIGVGEGAEGAYDEDKFINPIKTPVTAENALAECAHWDYKEPFKPYDEVGATEGGATTGSDGHSFYGNVFGGGSGYYPYKKSDNSYEWLRSAGLVEGNTNVEVTGGHILNNLYGGNEMSDVTGTCNVTMTGGTLGVPRTLSQIAAHPVSCYLFGAGKGDQRTHFNTSTNVGKANVKVGGNAIIYGSVFGGGEDGHVLEDINVEIQNNGLAFTVGTGENQKTYHFPIIGTTGTSYVDGNIFGGGRGFSGDALTAGSVGGNITVDIKGGIMLGSIYGGGRLASVGTNFAGTNDPLYGAFKEDVLYKEGDTDIPTGKQVGDIRTPYGHITVNISGGTIGNDVPDAKYGGNVFGGSMGRLESLLGQPNPLWPQLAQVKTTAVNISGNAHIKRSVYGGGEMGTVRDDAIINISGKTNTDGTVKMNESPTIEYNVFGGGYGSDIIEDTYEATIHTGSGETAKTYVVRPIEFAGCVGGDTHVNIRGGLVKRTVYGGGEMATVGLVDLNKTKSQIHNDVTSGFALSWPYEYAFIQEKGGTANINITGGRIGLSGKDKINSDVEEDNGDIYGGGKGIAGDRYDMSFCGNVRNSVVTIDVPTPTNDQIEIYDRTGSNKWTLRLKELTSDDKIPGIAGSVYGGGEDGHVIENAVINITNGYIGHSVYGGGKGKGTYKQAITDKDIPCNTAGKVYGNTTIEMTGGWIMRNIYGGGNLGSVGKGNYAGGTDDYYPNGYGEKTTSKLWEITKDSEDKEIHDDAWHFLNSGIATVNITGGTVGYMVSASDKDKISVCDKDDLPTGNVFGGCRGQSATEESMPTYEENPDFFLGYVNKTEVNIGSTDAATRPTIYGSVYGGGQDGHVRYQTNVTINKGEIGIPYNDDNIAIIGDNLDDMHWLNRGNVYGAGSGIGTYDSNNKDENNKPIQKHSSSSGSITRSTNVTVNSGITGKTGGVIYRNVYGGGSLASVGPPLIGTTECATKEQSLCSVTIDGAVGSTDENIFVKEYGGEVYGASRGETLDPTLYNNFADFASVIWTKVLLKKNAVIMGNVFGGGDDGIVRKDSEVIVGE